MINGPGETSDFIPYISCCTQAVFFKDGEVIRGHRFDGSNCFVDEDVQRLTLRQRRTCPLGASYQIVGYVKGG
jgi:hypothetical protein